MAKCTTTMSTGTNVLIPKNKFWILGLVLAAAALFMYGSIIVKIGSS